MYLLNLYKELGLQHKFSRAVLAGIVFETLRSNNCGLTEDNEYKVAHVLMEGVCDEFLFDVISLAAHDCAELVGILESYTTVSSATLFTHHIWPYLRKNEVIPGVCLQD